MRINILQHTPNEGPGAIKEWAHQHNHDIYVYHPYQFGVFPTVDSTDMLVILGGPMSVNDNLDWIQYERELIVKAIQGKIPIFGACFGAQQIAKSLGKQVTNGPAKEVGWAPVSLQTDVIPDFPAQLKVLHWHQEVFEIPDEAELLFSSEAVTNQGFVLHHRIVGLQFHFEPQSDDVREIVINDGAYLKGSVLNQTESDVLNVPVPEENKQALFKILDYINGK